MSENVISVPAPDEISSALAAVPPSMFWMLGKGKLTPDEPLYAFQLIEPGTGKIIAETEGDDIPGCIREALAKAAGGR